MRFEMFNQDREDRAMAMTNKDQSKNLVNSYKIKMMMTATSDR